MEKLNVEKVKRFVNSGKHHEDSILVISVILCCISVFIMVFDYTLESVVVMTPFIIFALFYYLKFRGIKNPQHKHYDLFMGVGALVISLASQCGFFLGVPLPMVQKIFFTLILALINLIVVGLMIFVANLTIKSNKTRVVPATVAGVTGIGAGGGVLLGTSLDNLVGEDIAFSIIFALFSVVCSLLSICIVRYHYAGILERCKTEDGSGNNNTGDGSMC